MCKDLRREKKQLQNKEHILLLENNSYSTFSIFFAGIKQTQFALHEMRVLFLLLVLRLFLRF
jgi:hypothetical protein